MSGKVVTLDVREDLRRGREPFGKIMQAINGLKASESLRLIVPFEPVPLYGVLARQGFSHRSTAGSDGSYEVLFFRGTGEPQAKAEETAVQGAGSPVTQACTGKPVLDVDARGLEPPQPLVKILEALATLPPGVDLRAHTDRRPMHLYAQLEERGFTGESQEQEDGSFITYVRRR
jgi:uncharacterized protein (DUF2249 family)